jgi:hypothetical protein
MSHLRICEPSRANNHMFVPYPNVTSQDPSTFGASKRLQARLLMANEWAMICHPLARMIGAVANSFNPLTPNRIDRSRTNLHAS